MRTMSTAERSCSASPKQINPKIDKNDFGVGDGNEERQDVSEDGVLEWRRRQSRQVKTEEGLLDRGGDRGETGDR